MAGIVYYNENNPYCAAWLRNLINAGAIAYGHVDERSIEDVRPTDLTGYSQCHFFAGIGVWSRALRTAGCTDGKWRPVEPWTFPLVNGPASTVGRVRADQGNRAGRLKGYGNAVNLWAAVEFINSFKEQIV